MCEFAFYSRVDNTCTFAQRGRY